jgi:hypothetical protein
VSGPLLICEDLIARVLNDDNNAPFDFTGKISLAGFSPVEDEDQHAHNVLDYQHRFE